MAMSGQNVSRVTSEPLLALLLLPPSLLLDPELPLELDPPEPLEALLVEPLLLVLPPIEGDEELFAPELPELARVTVVVWLQDLPQPGGGL
jgi:hypothetical protein